MDFYCERALIFFVSKCLHYEAKLCVLRILSGIRNRLFWIPQKNYLNHCTDQNCFKNRRICGIRKCICGIQNSLWNLQKNFKTFVSLNWAVARIYPAENKIAWQTNGVPHLKLLYEKATSGLNSLRSKLNLFVSNLEVSCWLLFCWLAFSTFYPGRRSFHFFL